MFPNLRAELARKNFTLERFAKLAGFKKTTFYDKYYGRSEFTLKEAQKIRDALELSMSVEELFQEEIAK